MAGDVRRTTAKKKGDTDMLDLLDEKNKLVAKYNRYVAIKVDMSAAEFEQKYRQKQKDIYTELMKVDIQIDHLQEIRRDEAEIKIKARYAK